jgi:hypothetical protein
MASLGTPPPKSGSFDIKNVEYIQWCQVLQEDEEETSSLKKLLVEEVL